MIIPIQKIRAGQHIVLRNGKGTVVAEHLASKVNLAPRGCWFHVHVELEDRRKWCYDYGEEVEVA